MGLDADLWPWTLAQIASKDDLRRDIEAALARCGNIDRANRRLEVGWTWIAKDCSEPP